MGNLYNIFIMKCFSVVDSIDGMPFDNYNGISQ